MKHPTKVQVKYLEFIWHYFETHGWWPSVIDIMNGMGCASTNNVAGHLRALQRKHLLFVYPMLSRAMRITKLGHGVLGHDEIPVCSVLFRD